MDETTPLGGPSRVLGGRYVLQGLIGQGGMADVELAYDQMLDRQVAVKLLHQRYASDPAFLARFRREAQAAASLNHPNVVAVYDTGEEDARPYIVMEYVSGHSLRDVLRSQGVLPQRAAEITVDAALGLHYAHERGLVHRDIKPGNILISDEGAVKVADFGIARAVNAETVTQTAAVFGTAAYVSPEQAQGSVVDRRSDVYSLGCVLYELLTGQQPFGGESAVAVAYKHVSEYPTPPTQLNREIPATVEAVVMKALEKDADARYQSARDFGADLQRSLAGMAVSAPPVVLYERTQALEASPRTAVLPVQEHEEDYWYSDDRAGRRRAGYVVLTLLLLALMGGAVFLAANLMGEETANVQVPNVVGENIVDAQNLLLDAGLEPRLGEQTASPEYGPNEVISTDPEPLMLVPEGSVVTLNYSSGPPLAEVPDVTGRPEEEARAILLEEGFGIGVRQSEPSDEVEEGLVIRTDPPANTQQEVGSDVGYVVSDGPATYTLPRVEGLSEEDATELLRTFCDEPPCVEVQRILEFHPSVPEGRVIRQSPGASEEVEPGAVVTIVVSRGPEATATPTPTPTPPPPATEPPTESPSPAPTPTPTGTETGLEL